MSKYFEGSVKPVVTLRHHGRDVQVIDGLQNMHRQNCLCYQDCAFFNPGHDDNCHMANAVYQTCVKYGMVTPVFECPKYSTVDPSKYDVKELVDALNYFCDRVEAGTILSRNTYGRFCTVLGRRNIFLNPTEA